MGSSAEEMCGASDVIYTQTPGSTTCVEKSWLKPHATIICSGSDQPTKQEIPTDILKASKYVSDLTKQTSKVGELRSAEEMCGASDVIYTQTPGSTPRSARSATARSPDVRATSSSSST